MQVDLCCTGLHPQTLLARARCVANWTFRVTDHCHLLAAMRLVGGATEHGGIAKIPIAAMLSSADRKNGSELPQRPAPREREELIQRIQPGPIPVEHRQGVEVKPDEGRRQHVYLNSLCNSIN